MGKITVIGHAEREVSYDQVTISIVFKAYEKTATRASEMVMRQCEDFLAALKKKGISLNQIHLGEDSISESYRSNDEGTMAASRSIKMDVPYNMDFMNYLLNVYSVSSAPRARNFRTTLTKKKNHPHERCTTA